MDDVTRKWLEQIRKWHKDGEYGGTAESESRRVVDAIDHA